MKNLIIFTITILFVLIFSSCTTVYVPTEINVPAFNEPNQFKGGISVGSSGTNVGVGYSFYKNFGFISDYSYLHRTGNNPVFQRQWGVGLGYYARIQRMDSVFYEIFGGYSQATTNSAFKEQDFSIGTGYENADYYRFFLQQDISFQQVFIDFIVAIRFSYFNFTRYDTHEAVNPELPKAIGMEPAFKIRMGGEYLKIKFQMGFAVIAPIKGRDFHYDKSFFLVGLECSF